MSASVLYQYDYEYVVDLGSPLGLYYWTQTWYLSDPFVTGPLGERHNVFNNAMNALTPVGVTRSKARSRRLLPSLGVDSTFTVPYAGERVVSGGFNLINVPFIRFYQGERYVGFKRWRLPLYYSEYEGVELEAGYISLLSGHLDTLIAGAGLANWHGLLIDGYTIDPVVHMWQQRRGTYRRVAPVL